MKFLLEEEKLQADAVGWLTTERNYQEVFEDTMATGARLDSIGILEGRPCFIEVKVSLSSREVVQIESKISGSLRGHADSSNTHPQYVAMRTIWDGRSVPLFATIARSYTESGLADLVRVLEVRSSEWMFDFEIWQWTGDRLEVLARNANRTRDPLLFVEDVRIERRPRKRNADLEKLRTLAAARGVLDLFDHAIAVGRRVGLKLDYRTEHVTLTPVRGTGWLPVLPRQSSPDTGLVLDVAWPIVPHLKGLSLRGHGRGRFSYSRYSVSDPATLTRLVEAAWAATEQDER